MQQKNKGAKKSPLLTKDRAAIAFFLIAIIYLFLWFLIPGRPVEKQSADKPLHESDTMVGEVVDSLLPREAPTRIPPDAAAKQAAIAGSASPQIEHIEDRPEAEIDSSDSHKPARVAVITKKKKARPRSKPAKKKASQQEIWEKDAVAQEPAEDAVVRRLLKALESNESKVRVRAAFSLSRIGRAGSVVGPLINALDDSDTLVIAWAIRALGNQADSRAVEPVIACLSASALVDDAAEALAKIGDKRAIASLELIAGRCDSCIAVKKALARLKKN